MSLTAVYRVGRRPVFDRYMRCSKCDSWISRENPDIYRTAGGQTRHNRCGGRIRNKARSN